MNLDRAIAVVVLSFPAVVCIAVIIVVLVTM